LARASDYLQLLNLNPCMVARIARRGCLFVNVSNQV
jgi:hypothetical protein